MDEEQFKKRLAEQIASYAEFFQVLAENVGLAFDQLQQADSQFTRRQAVRAVFALIEGDTYARKHVALAGDDLAQRYAESLNIWFEPQFSMEERTLLREEQYELKDNGMPKTAQKFLKLLANVRFSFNAYARTIKGSYTLDVSGDGWQSLQRALEIRNRITHPKSTESLHISDSDRDDVDAAGNWYMNCVFDLMGVANRS